MSKNSIIWSNISSRYRARCDISRRKRVGEGSIIVVGWELVLEQYKSNKSVSSRSRSRNNNDSRMRSSNRTIQVRVIIVSVVGVRVGAVFIGAILIVGGGEEEEAI